MAEAAQVTAAEIDELLRARGARFEPTYTTPAPTQARLHYQAAVALLGWFDVALLEAGMGPLDGAALRSMLIGDCERVFTPRGYRWRLRDHVREATVRRLGTPAAVLRALSDLPADPTDVGRTMTEAYLRGAAPELSRQTAAQLHGTLHAVESLAPLHLELPGVDEIQECLGLAALLDPLRALVGEEFIGRDRELDIIADYVSARPGGAPDQPRLAIHGPGGVGKSTLVARFVLNQVDRPSGKRIPLAYLSFDRTDLAPHQPLTLLAEATRQLCLLYPAIEHDGHQLEKSVRATLRRLTAAERHRKPSSKTVMAPGPGTERDELVLLERFARLVASAVGDPDTPLLWVLDTFEQAQRRGPHSLDRLWVLLDKLQSRYPRLRVVFAGRAPLAGHPIQPLVLDGFDEDQALAFLRHMLEAIPVDEEFLREVIRQVSSNPLSLKLAAELLRKEGEQGVRQLREQRVVLAMLGAEEVQGILYRRILDRLDNPDLRLIANPGLVVRRVTPEIISEVLALPCGLGEVDADRARELFEALRQEASLVEPVPGEDAVVHRADVRRAMLRLLRRDDPAAVMTIHHRAVEYYHARSGPPARAEELYHRLALAEPAEVLDRYWDEEAGPLLASALEELPAASRAYLADRLDIPIDPETLREAESEIWASQAVRVGRELLDAGRANEALGVVLERSTDKLEVLTVAVDALATAGRLGEALSVVTNALQDKSAKGGPDSLIQLLMLGARIAEDAGEYHDALRWSRQARELAETATLTADSLAAAVAEARIYRRSGRSDSAEANALRAWLIEVSSRFSRQERARQPSLVRDLAAEVGKEVPSLVVDAARLHGVDIDGAAGVVLADNLGNETVKDVASRAAPADPATTDDDVRGLPIPGRPGPSDPPEPARSGPTDPQTDEEPPAWQGPTSAEAGIGISDYLEADPDRIGQWAGPLSDAWKAEVDQPTYSDEERA